MNRGFIHRLGFVFVIGLVLVASRLMLQAVPTQQAGTWESIGSMTESRTGAASVAFPDGRTAIVGGLLADGTATGSIVVINPADNSVTPAGELSAPRTGHTATLLEDGRVLVAGGTSNGVILSDIDIVDVAAATVTSSGMFLTQPRSGHAAARIADGQVLIAGGDTAGAVILASAELIDVTAATVNLTASLMGTARSGASATTMIDGRVLVAGGNDGTQDLASAEIYYPLNQSFSPAGTSLSQARSGHTALLLPGNGAVLIAGGTAAGEPGAPRVPVTTSDWFQPALFPDPFSWGEGAFAATGPLAHARATAMIGPYGEGYAFVSGGGSTEAEQFHFATIKTDKEDYAPGEPALITGSGWQPGEEVTLVFQEDPAVHADYVLTVTADDNGNFSYNSWAPEQHDLDVRFYLMATGALSQSRAQITFTDGTLQGVNVVTTTGTVIQGATAAYVVNVDMGGNTGACTVTLSVTTPLPAGAVASFSGGPNPFNATNLDFSRNLSITTTAATPVGAYVFTVQAAPSANCNGAAIATANGSLRVNSAAKTTPVITFNAPPAPTYGDGNFTVSATTTNTDSSALTYSYVSGPCAFVSGAMFSSTGAGTCVVQADGAETANFTAATAQQSVSIGKATLTVTASSPSVTYGDPVPAITAIYGGFVSPDTAAVLDAEPTCSTAYTPSNAAGTTPATNCSGGLDNNYAFSFIAGSVTIGQATLTISVSAEDAVYTGSPYAGATTCSALGVNSEEPLATPSFVGGVPTDVGNYTYSCSAGGPGTNYVADTETDGFEITPAPSVTTVSCPTSVTYTGAAQTPCTATVTGVGGLNLTPTVTTYANNIDAGTATASYAYSGDANHEASNDSTDFIIDPASSTTVVTCPANVTYTGSAQTPCTVSVTGAGGLNLTPAATYVNNTNVGTATASYAYAGDANHEASNDSTDFTIDPAASTTVVTCPTNVTYTGAAQTPCTVSVTGAGGLNLTPAATYVNNTNVGTATASYAYAGDANHEASNDSADFTIDPAASTTVVTCPANVTYTGSAQTPCTVSVTGAGGLNLTPAATYVNNINAGTATASYAYSGDANHEASNDSTDFTIDPAASTTVVTCPTNVTYTGAAQTPCSASVTGAGGLNLTPTPTYVNNINAGTATASYAYAGDANHEASNDSTDFAIDPAPSVTTVTCPPGPYTYTGAAQTPCSATVTGAGGLNETPTPTYTDNINAGVATASYAYSGDANHTASNDSDTFTIDPAPSVTTVTCPPGPYTYTGAAQTPCSATVTGAGGLNLTPTPTYVNNVDAGTATASYAYAGDANHEASNDSDTFTIDPAPSVTTVTCPPGPYTYTGSAQTPCSASVTGAGGLNLTPTPTYANNINAGLATASYAFAGDANHEASNDSDTFTIGVAPSTTTVTCLPGPFTYTGIAQTPCSASVTGAGGLNLTPTPTYANNINAGLATASYAFAGDANHEASNDSDTFTINKANATFTVTPYNVTYDGLPHTAAVSTITGVNGETGATVGTVNVSNTTHTNAGTYASDSWTFTGGANYNNQGPVTITDKINKANPTCTISGFTGAYDGLPHGASGSCTGVLGETLAGLNLGASFTLVPGGTAIWAFTDVTGNYNNASGSVPIVITTSFCFTGFLAPIDGSVEAGNGGSFGNPVRSFKLGSTVPVKFLLNSLIGATCGAPVTTGIHTLQAVKYSNATDSDPAIDATPTDAATTGNQFKLTGTEWHFNISTKIANGFSVGTWLLQATLQDGSVKTVWITIKK